MQELIRTRIREMFSLLLLKHYSMQAWGYLWRLLSEQRTQIFLFCPVFMGLGVLGYFALSFEPPAFTGLGIFLMTLTACWFFQSRTYLQIVFMFFAFVAFGFTVAQFRTLNVHTPILDKKMGPVEVSGQVRAVENLGMGAGMRLTLEHSHIEKVPASKTPRLIRVKVRKDQEVYVGQHVKMLAGLNPPARPAYPGGFDFQHHLYFKSIGAIGFAYGGVEVTKDVPADGFFRRIERLRNAISERVLTHVGAQAGGVTAALMVGQRGAISETDQEAMRGSGLAHMLAISGLHVGLFSGVIFFFSRLLMVSIPYVALHWPVKKIAALFALSGALAYMMLAGATIPTQRAVMMTGIVLLAIVLDRSPLSMRLVAFAAVVVLVIAPDSLLSPSFQMSFSAVAALVAFYQWTAPWWRAQHRQAGVFRRTVLYVLGVCTTTILATLATAPFALYHFQTLAVYGFLGNILAMPLLTFIVMPLSVLAYLLMPFGLEAWMLQLMGAGVAAILEVAHFVSNFEGAVLRVSSLSSWALAVFASAFLGLVLLKGHLKAVSFVLMAAAFVIVWRTPQPFMLASSDLRLIGIFDGRDLFVNTKRRDRFTRGIWESRFGLKDGQAMVWPKEGETAGLFCGEQGCRVKTGMRKISILKSEAGMAEDCLWADIMIVQDGYDLQCPDNSITVIDRKNAKWEGPYAFYGGPGGLEIRAAGQERGRRPWVH